MGLAIRTATLLLLLSCFIISDTDALSSFRKVKNKIFRRTDKTAPAPPQPFPASGAEHYGRSNSDLKNVLEQNRYWAYQKQTKIPTFFDTLGKVHQPSYMWIGCSDARVPPNVIMGEDPGSVFVVRNVANMVVNTDFNLVSALDYAVGVLKVSHIIVCGHYECGGVIASTKNVDHTAPLENWLRNIRDVYRTYQDELDAINDPNERHRRLVEVNAIEQAINVYKTAVVQKRRVETFQDKNEPFALPVVHACVFDPHTGALRKLEVDFEEKLADLESIYGLYQA